MNKQTSHSLFEVIEKLAMFIRDQNLKPGDRLPSERKLQDRWQISRSAIRRATACMIAQGSLHREGYKLLVAGQVEQSESPDPLCHVLLAMSPGSPLMQGIQEVAAADHTPCLPIFCDFANQRDDLARVIDSGSHGFVIWPYFMADIRDLLDRARERQIPFVVLDLEIGDYDFVGTDNEKGMELAVQHLAQLGHKHLAYLTIRAANSSAIRRRTGFQHACLQCDCRRSYNRIIETPVGDDLPAMQRTLDTLMRDHPQVTGVLCSNAWLAYNFREACRLAGKRVPDDYSVVGFDRVTDDDAEFTTVIQDLHQLGATAMLRLRQLMRQTQQHSQRRISRIRLEPYLQIGRTTAVPRHAATR